MPLILLAEEESSTVDHVRSALSSQGWLVKTVGNRDQALRAASEFAPQLVLVNDRLAGAEDLVRTFSRRSGGPGVVLLTSGETETATASPDVDAILAKPLDTDALIETIRRGLVDGKSKPPPPPVTDTRQVLSSAEIFGDLLGDILDPEEPSEPDKEAAPPAAPKEPEPVAEDEPVTEVAPEPEPAPVMAEEIAAESELVVDVAASATIAEEPEPVVEMKSVAARESHPDESEAIPVAGLEDLEEVVREGVEAWADSIHPEDIADDQDDKVAELAEATQIPVEPEPESEEDLDSKLEDTLAGVLAESLTQVETPAPVVDTPAMQSGSVDDLLNNVLGGLDLGTTTTSQAVEEVIESTIDSEIEALAASVEVEPIAEIETPDFAADLEELTGVRQAPEPTDAHFEVELEDELAAEVEAPVAAEPDEIEEEAASEAEVEPPVAEPEARKETATPPVATVKAVEFGEYSLEEQIGVGGMASVWKARRKGVEGFEKRVAIKKILPQAAENEDFVEMFIDEAKLAAQLNHSNITHIYDLGKIDDDYFIAMEYVEGKNLRQILDKTRKKQKPIPIGVALFVAAQIADALDYAHRSKDFNDAELGLVHRDVSPQNVLISYEGDIKLCDFGIAKAVSKISTTQMGALKGKLQYMSPEQAWGRSIDHRSDLFSLGTLLYEMLTGKRLFSGESEMAVLEAVREADVGTQVIQSTEIPAGVKGVLLRTLARDPDDRYESAAELQRGLEELVKDESPAPGTKSLSAFVRDLLDMQAEPMETVEEDEPAAPIEVADDLEWAPEPVAAEEDEDEDTTPWLRRVLTRLLPVILVVAVGGGIVAGLMQRNGGATEPTVEATSQVREAPVIQTETSEETPVDPQGQPPPAAAAAEPTPAIPAKQQPQEPEPEPIPAAQPPMAKSEPEPPVGEPATNTTVATDPELERRVEEDLQRVQELMASPEDSPESSSGEQTAEVAVAEAPVTLESLWSDVTAPGDEGNESESRVEPEVIEPSILEIETPAYTDAARQAGVEGTIRVSVLVGTNGQAQDVKLIEGLDSQVGLEEALLEAARNAKYQPATRDGAPVEMWYQVAVFFEP